MVSGTNVDGWGALTLPAEAKPLNLNENGWGPIAGASETSIALSPGEKGLKVTIDGWLSDPRGNEAAVRLGSLWIGEYDDDLFASICLDDAFALLLRLEPFFVNWIVSPDGADGYIRALSSAVNSSSSSAANSLAAAGLLAPKLKIGWEGPNMGDENCDASYPVANVSSTIVNSAVEVLAQSNVGWEGPAALDEVDRNCNMSCPAANVSSTIVGSVAEVLDPDRLGWEGLAIPDMYRTSSSMANVSWTAVAEVLPLTQIRRERVQNLNARSVQHRTKEFQVLRLALFLCFECFFDDMNCSAASGRVDGNSGTLTLAAHGLSAGVDSMAEVLVSKSNMGWEGPCGTWRSD